MRKKIWITGSLLLVCIIVVVIYFSYFYEKKQEPRGTFVKGVEIQWRQNV